MLGSENCLMQVASSTAGTLQPQGVVSVLLAESAIEKFLAISAIVVIMIIGFYWKQQVLTCSNCGSKARRQQWSRRGGCPTCGSDLSE